MSLRRAVPAAALLLALLVSLLVVSLRAVADDGYDTPDRARFAAYLAHGERSQEFQAFQAHLREHEVHDVVPAWTLWRQGTDWRGLREPAFAVPPRKAWPGIVPTLQVLRDHVIPASGPVEVVSGFRTERYNARAGGAKGSRHKWFEAVDVVPRRTWARSELHRALLSVWRRRGPSTSLGLGLYGGTRFHVDTHRHRRW